MFHLILWVLWIAAALAAYFTTNGTAPVLYLLGSFAVLEGWGVLRDGHGDTLTETVRSFYRGGWSRGFLVLGFTGFLGLWFISAIPGWEYLNRWAGFSLGIGLMAWLAVHFSKTDGSWG